MTAVVVDGMRVRACCLNNHVNENVVVMAFCAKYRIPYNDFRFSTENDGINRTKAAGQLLAQSDILQQRNTSTTDSP